MDSNDRINKIESDNILLSEEKKYAKVIQEIIKTEISYLSDLNLMIDNYLKPFYDIKWKSDYKNIFGNIEELASLSIKLIENLNSQVANPEEFSRQFIYLKDEFIQIYGIYCINYVNAMFKLEQANHDSEFKEFIDTTMNKLGQKLSIASYLLKPVQRILKYQLLLHSLADALKKIDLPNDITIESQLAMEFVSSNINKMKREHEEYHCYLYFKENITDIENFDIKNSGKFFNESKAFIEKEEVSLIVFERYAIIIQNIENKLVTKLVISIRQLDVCLSQKKDNYLIFKLEKENLHIKLPSHKIAKIFFSLIKELRKNILDKVLSKEATFNDEWSLPVLYIKGSDRITFPIQNIEAKLNPDNKLLPPKLTDLCEISYPQLPEPDLSSKHDTKLKSQPKKARRLLYELQQAKSIIATTKFLTAKASSRSVKSMLIEKFNYKGSSLVRFQSTASLSTLSVNADESCQKKNSLSCIKGIETSGTQVEKLQPVLKFSKPKPCPKNEQNNESENIKTTQNQTNNEFGENISPPQSIRYRLSTSSSTENSFEPLSRGYKLFHLKKERIEPFGSNLDCENYNQSNINSSFKMETSKIVSVGNLDSEIFNENGSDYAAQRNCKSAHEKIFYFPDFVSAIGGEYKSDIGIKKLKKPLKPLPIVPPRKPSTKTAETCLNTQLTGIPNSDNSSSAVPILNEDTKHSKEEIKTKK
ncbi:hypothetical protein HZS_112, partial [Henneguya salminicola]